MNRKTFFIFIAAFLAIAFFAPLTFALSRQSLASDLKYYRRICVEQNLDTNGRAYVLARIEEKYAAAGVDLSPLKAEIRKLKDPRNVPPAQPVITAEGAQETPSSSGSVEKILVSETADESRITIIARGITRHNYFLLHDPEPAKKTMIVLDLYGADDRLSAKAKDITPRHGLFARVRAAQFDQTTVRIVAELRADSPYRVVKEGDRWLITVPKHSGADKAEPGSPERAVLTLQPPAARAAGMSGGNGALVSGPGPAEQVLSRTPDTASVPATVLDRGTTSSYRIETGDILGITVFPAEELSREVVVQLDGTIAFPLIGTSRVKGLTPHQLEEDLKKNLNRYLSNPQVTVTIKQFSRRQVFVTGETRSVGAFNYRENMRLMEFISSLGGFTDNANRKEIKVYRGAADKRKVFTVDVEDTIRSGDFSRDFLLEPGDIIEVPQGRLRVAILGDVRTPGYLDYKENLHLLELISEAGGFADTAQLSKVSILREGKAGEKKVSMVNLNDILSGKTPDVPVQHGDTVYVPRKNLASASWFAGTILPWLSLVSLVLVIRGGI